MESTFASRSTTLAEPCCEHRRHACTPSSRRCRRPTCDGRRTTPNGRVAQVLLAPRQPSRDIRPLPRCRPSAASSYRAPKRSRPYGTHGMRAHTRTGRPSTASQPTIVSSLASTPCPTTRPAQPDHPVRDEHAHRRHRADARLRARGAQLGYRGGIRPGGNRSRRDAVDLLIDTCPGDRRTRRASPSNRPSTCTYIRPIPSATTCSSVHDAVELRPIGGRRIAGSLDLPAEVLVRLVFGRLDAAHTPTLTLVADDVTSTNYAGSSPASRR